MFSKKTPITWPSNSVTAQRIQVLKTTSAQPRQGAQSPNPVLAGSATLPQHVSGVTAILKKSSDVSTKATITFQRAVQDGLYVDSSVHVSGYQGNPNPVKIATGQSPISFSLNNTGETLAFTVQANGPTGSAPLSSAPTTTGKLVSTPLATVPTVQGNGTFGLTPYTAPPHQWFSSVSAAGVFTATPPGRGNYANLNCPNSISGGGTGSMGIAMADYVSGSSAFARIDAATATSGPVAHLRGAGSGVGGGNGATLYDNYNAPLGTPGNITLGCLKYWEYMVGIGNATAVWYYIGLGDIQPNGGAFLDHGLTLTSDIVGFRFDPVNYSDTHWMALCQISSGAVTAVSTGIVPDGSNARHLFAFTCDGTTITYFIDHVQVATIAVSATSGTSQVYYSFASGSDQSSGTASQVDLFASWIYYETAA